jgi:hypothetical protein
MSNRQLLLGTVVGGIVLYAVGYLIWDVAFKSFFEGQMGSATGVDRDQQIVWAMAVGNLAMGALITLAIAARGATTMGAGLRIGATVSFLCWLSVDFIFYGATNLHTLTGAIADPLLELVHGGITGAIVAPLLARRVMAAATA